MYLGMSLERQGNMRPLRLGMLLTYLRYALATFCFAASVGCLVLSQ